VLSGEVSYDPWLPCQIELKEQDVVLRAEEKKTTALLEKAQMEDAANMSRRG